MAASRKTGMLTGKIQRAYSCTTVKSSNKQQWSVDGVLIPAGDEEDKVPAAVRHAAACKLVVAKKTEQPAGRQRDAKGRFTCIIYPPNSSGIKWTHWFDEDGNEIPARMGSQPSKSETEQGIKCKASPKKSSSKPAKAEKSAKVSPKTSPSKPTKAEKTSPGRKLLKKVKGLL